VTNAANHSLDDLTNSVPKASLVYSNIMLTGSGSTFTGSDHYPIVGDYNIVIPGPAATPVFGSLVATNRQIQFNIVGTAGDNYAIEVSTNLTKTNWVSILTNASPFVFKDTNTLQQRFYRARSVP
jgi:hypothetical protein